MLIKLIAMLAVLVMALMLGALIVSKLRARASQVRKLKHPEWSATVYCCAESRAEF